MEGPVPRSDSVNKLRFAADAAFAMLAGMLLDVFTPLQGGPKPPKTLPMPLVLVPHDVHRPHGGFQRLGKEETDEV
jgi:hypothetical protein